jgi:Lysyl oxidase
MSTKVTVRLYCVMAAALALALSVLVATASPPAEAAATDRLPDLRMAPLDDLQIENTQDSRRLLRFDALIVNVGAGAFELRGERDAAATEMNVTQHIFDSSGGQRDRPTTATMFYAGDGHNHWHVKDLAEYSLLKKRNNKRSVVRTDAKQGFCFFDTRPFGSTQEAHYLRGCANGQPNALTVTVGISRGWGDLYAATTVGQYVEITGLADGRYRLKAKADSGQWFKEKKEKNNSTWVDIQISGSSGSVIGYGPAAQPI